MASGAAPLALVFATVLELAPLLAGEAAEACSSDTFSVEGHALGIELCARATAKSRETKSPGVTLTETFSLRGQPPYVRQVPLEVAHNTETARTIDDVPLAQLGIAKTLHLTIAYKPGSVRLEHALLVPGAVPLK